MNRPNTTGTILTFIVGLGVGAAAALLLAPKSGDELRSDITDRINDEVDAARGAVRGARRNMKRRADKLVSMAKNEIQEVMDAGDEAYTEAKNAQVRSGELMLMGADGLSMTNSAEENRVQETLGCAILQPPACRIIWAERIGTVDLQCNAGHIWMNGVIFVVNHPYYAITDEHGEFQLTGVPPGEYEIVAWHEGWRVAREEPVLDVGTQTKTKRLFFTEPQTWEKKLTVAPNGHSTVEFTISER